MGACSVLSQIQETAHTLDKMSAWTCPNWLMCSHFVTPQYAIKGLLQGYSLNPRWTSCLSPLSVTNEPLFIPFLPIIKVLRRIAQHHCSIAEYSLYELCAAPDWRELSISFLSKQERTVDRSLLPERSHYFTIELKTADTYRCPSQSRTLFSIFPFSHLSSSVHFFLSLIYLLIYFFTPFLLLYLIQAEVIEKEILQNQKLSKCFLFPSFPLSLTTVLYRQLWGDGEDPAGPRSQRQRSGQRTVDAAARRCHMWSRRTGQDSHRTVRHVDTLPAGLHAGIYSGGARPRLKNKESWVT